MKEKISKISGYFKVEKLRNDRRVIVFLVCLLIATTLWFLNALSKDYSTTISYPVKYINPPRNQFLANEPPSKLELKVNVHGFTLLRHKLSLSFSPIILNLTNITKDVTISGNGYRVNTNRLIRSISEQVSNEITINSIQPDIINLKLDSLKTKMVPVKSNITLEFKPQFNLTDQIGIIPEQVQITGPATVIDTVNFLYTEQKTYNKLDTEIKKTVNIIHPEKTTITPGKVTLNIPIEKYTEKELKVPVQILNKPEDVNVKLFPSEIKLTLLVGLSEFDNIGTSGFKAFVDFENIDNSSDNIAVTVQSEFPGVQIVRYFPQNVEYLIESN